MKTTQNVLRDITETVPKDMANKPEKYYLMIFFKVFIVC